MLVNFDMQYFFPPVEGDSLLNCIDFTINLNRKKL